MNPPPIPPRIYLSPPDMGPDERRFVEEAFATNWIAPVGPHLTALEAEMCEATGIRAAACLSSGTAALHLAVRLLGTLPGDEIFCSTFTFIASANPIVYEGAKPVFIDADKRSWNMDPVLLAEALAERAREGRLPRAIIVADIYGQCADWTAIEAVARHHGVPIIEDAAEAVGSTYDGRPAGSFGAIGIYSFNGNKILNSGGGGMILSADQALVDRARDLSTQAREATAHYEHRQLGYNYRMSNVLAGIGRGQLRSLAKRIARKQAVNARYREALGDLPGLQFMPQLPNGQSNHWLTCLTLDSQVSPVTRDQALTALAAANIEARPLWNPLHRQPLYQASERYGGSVADELFATGLCLPSGSALSSEEIDRVVTVVRQLYSR